MVFVDFQYPVMRGKETSLDPEKEKKLEEALGWVDRFIHKSGGYCAGKHVTLADFAIISSIATIEVRLFSLGIESWWSRVKPSKFGQCICLDTVVSEQRRC